MPNFYIMVKVTTDTQHKAFRFVEDALDQWMEKLSDAGGHVPEEIHLSTADGMHTTLLRADD